MNILFILIPILLIGFFMMMGKGGGCCGGGHKKDDEGQGKNQGANKSHSACH